MVLKEILNRLLDKGVKRVVSTITFDESIDLSQFVTEYVEDVRSAIFTAYGMAKIDSNPVIIITEDTYLPSTYTGLTEAWFQRIPVIVISLNSDTIESSRYLERCIDASFFVDSLSDLKDTINKIMRTSGPTLIKIKDENNDNARIDYSSILKCLEEIPFSQNVICYNSKIKRQGVTDVDQIYKYGILSKYVGSLCGGEKSILCMPENLLGLDSNIFNIRNFPSDFRLIVKSTGSGHWDKMEKWINKNGVNTFVFNQTDGKDEFESKLQQSPVAILVV